MSGWIKLHRKMLDNPLVGKPTYFSLWIILLLKANHKECKIIWNGEFKTIKAGQFITGRKALKKECGIPETTIERILNMLENGHQIKQQKTSKYRLITIVNWEQYQDRNAKVDNKRTTNGQQTDTNKNDNNDNNEKKYIQGDPLIHKHLVEKEDIINNMYNYEPVDENGNPKKKKISRITKDENNMLISVGYMWQEMCAKALKLDESEVVMNNIYYAIRKCYDREKFKKEDFKELFKYFFESKINEEDKLSFDLCLSQKYVAKFKLSRKIKSKKFNNVSVSSDIKL